MNGQVDYGEQPDRQVTRVVPDEIDPAFSQVEFTDGTMETMPTSQAEALPQLPPMGPPQAPMGPPPPPPADPAAAPGPSAPPAMGPPAAPGMLGMFSAAQPSTELVQPVAETRSATPQVDMGEIVAPAQPGGFAPFSTSTSESATSTDTVESPEVMGARIDEAIEADARSAWLRDNMAAASKREMLDTELDARDAQVEEQSRMLRQAELERAEHERIFKAVEATPIDEDAFWSESPGRAAGAWIALALSGFLQGATKGQNPALNQMVQALNHAQDRYVQNQQKSRDGQLRTRERLMGSLDNAISTTRLQLSGIMEKRIMLEAQREGIPPTAGLSTYIAERQMKRAEWKTQIGQRVAHSATIGSQSEARATPGTGPQTRFDVQLQALGVPRQKHGEAMAAGLGDQVSGATKVASIRDALKRIADANGGELPAQSTLSWNQLGLAPFAARMGVKNAEEQVNTKQLLTQATLAYMESLKSLKGIDANAEREKFEQSINTGVAGSTLGALDAAVERAERSALATASGFAGGNARRYVDLLKAQQNEPERGELRSLQRKTGAPPPTEAQTLDQAAGAPAPTSQGGSATRPLAQSQRELQRAIQSSEDLQGYNADALARIISFESGGKPGAKNDSGATGLIQFMPKVFDGMKKPPGYEGVTHADLPDLTVEEQLPLVAAYFRQAGVPADADVGEYYLAVAAPAALGKPDETVVYRRGSKAWEQNPAWRPAGGGDITAGDIRAKGRRL